MMVVTYEIELIEPCLVTALQGDANSAVAFDYLPGAVLRGAVIDRYIWQRRRQDPTYHFDAAGDEEQFLFFNGRTRYLNAYLLVDDQRTFPTPLTWHVEKGRTPHVYDFAVDDARDSFLDQEWKSCSFPFTLILAQGEQAYEITLQRHVAIHIARDRQPNRQGREPNRAVYRYDALAAGQCFKGVIFCPDEQVADEIGKLLPTIMALGGSRSSGYGRVAVTNIQTHHQWREIPELLTVDSPRLTITLLSDMLIRDKNGQLVANAQALTDALSAQLGCSLKLEQAFYRSTPVGGFNRKWGLPLPQALALRMGSVFIFTLPDCTADQLQGLETGGVGERLSEGFGRVAVNAHREAQVNLRALPRTVTPSMTLTQTSPDVEVAQQIVDRLLRERLDALLEKRADDIGQNVRGMKRNQLYALRQVVYAALLKPPSAGRELLYQYLSKLQQRRISREQLERTRIEGQKLIDWLTRRLSDETEIWRRDLQVNSLPQIGGIEPNLKQLAYEYNLRLVAAVLSRAAKVNEVGG